MHKILIYALRDWSFANIEPALKGFEYDRWHANMYRELNINKYTLVITCEPHEKGWKETYNHIKGIKPILGLQQGLYWTDKPNPKAFYPCDKFMVWGQQMAECCNCKKEIIVTGNPRFDKFWNIHTEDNGYTLVLGDGGDDKTYYTNDREKIVFQPHPNILGYKMPVDTEELIRCASKVVFKSTGAGIIALIMKKPVEIYPSERKSYDKFKDMGYDNFVKWAVTDNKATERIKCVISQYM